MLPELVRLVVETNILITALLTSGSLSEHLVLLWRGGLYDLFSSIEQIEEIRRVTRYPKLRERLAPARTGRLVNDVRRMAVLLTNLPETTASSDPFDNYLLAMSEAGDADFLITGDKQDLLALKRYKGTQILTVRGFLTREGRLPRNP